MSEFSSRVYKLLCFRIRTEIPPTGKNNTFWNHSWICTGCKITVYINFFTCFCINSETRKNIIIFSSQIINFVFFPNHNYPCVSFDTMYRYFVLLSFIWSQIYTKLRNRHTSLVRSFIIWLIHVTEELANHLLRIPVRIFPYGPLIRTASHGPTL